MGLAIERRPQRPNALRHIDLTSVAALVSILVVALGVAMLIPAYLDLRVDNPDWQVFVGASGVSVLIGGLTWLSTRRAIGRIAVREAFLFTGLSWITLAAFGCLPFYFSSLKLDFASAYFEAMSGLTTTGSTTIVGLDTAPPGLLLWRALLQWIGGIGIIVIALAVLPELRVGGMQLFHMESSDRSDKIMPRVNALAGTILGIYTALSVTCFVAYWVVGLSAFDALIHAMTTLATGGFSTSDTSFGGFNNPAAEWVAITFMTAAGLPFLAYIALIKGGWRTFLRDPQIRLFTLIIMVFAAIQAIYLYHVHLLPQADAIRVAFFNTTTVLSTTGYAVMDYTPWGPFYNGVIFIIMLIGGCAGSSAGGLKMLRLGVLFAVIRQHVARIIRPHGIFPARWGDKPIPDDVAASVSSFLFIYIALMAMAALALSLSGLDGVTALSAAATSIANVGPGLGETIGPAGTFASFTDLQKWICSLTMLVGRLELFTILVLFVPSFWR